MKVLQIAFATFLFLGSPAVAQDVVLRGQELQSYIDGKNFRFEAQNSQGAGSMFAYYKKGGQYEFTAPNGSKERGTWSVKDDRVCIDFTSGNSRCDQIVKDGNRMLWKASNGRKYPFTVQ